MPRNLKIRGHVVGQFPNTPLWVAFAALILSRVTHDGALVNDISRAVAWVSLSIWAYLEAVDGVNAYRRAIGVVGLVLIVVSITRALG